MLSRRLPSDGMRFGLLSCSFALCIALTFCQCVSAAETVVRLEFLDPVRGAGHVARPCVSVDDAGVVRWNEAGEVEPRQAAISDEQQAELMRELVESLDIGSLDSDEMWREIVAEGLRVGLSPNIEGAGITRITVSLSDAADPSRGEVVVECPACQLLATRYPAVESLQRFAKCQTLLENLRAVMQLGGFEESQRLTELANAHLAGLGHAGEPLCCRDLRFVRGLPDGAKFATYHREEPSACSVSVTIEPGRPPVFQVGE